MKKGFTLVEIIIVIGVITLLSTMAILYSHTGEQQITLFQEQVKILNVLSRAKSLSINTFARPDIPCGFGVHFDETDNSFRIFRETAAEIDCSDADFQRADNGSEDLEAFNLNPAISFDNLTVDDVIFFPPEPAVAILPGFLEEATITLKIVGTGQTAAIKINNRGMITTQ